MSYVISTKEMLDGKKIGEIYIKGDYKRYRENLLVFKGELYNRDEDKELFNHIVQEGTGIVSRLKGEFFLVYCDNDSKKIYIANDKLGRETLFYFYDANNFVLSDDFWEILNLIEPSTSDVDIQSVKEFVIFYHPLFYKTIIKNLNFFPPASIGEYYLKDFTFKIKQYWDFKYRPNESLTLGEAVNRLDYLFDSAMKRIKEKNTSNATYGVGLSGGLDSRLIPHYALKHNMRLISFIIGEKRPHKFVLSRDHESARKLAKYYNLDHYEIAYDSETFEDKSFYDVRYNPMGSSNFFIAVQNKLPKFDILLTGMNGGELLGSTLPNDIMKLNEEELADAIIKTFSYMYVSKDKSFISKLSKLSRFMFRCDYLQSNLDRRESINGVINRDDFIEIKSKIYQFIKDNSDKSNIDIFQKYLFWHLVSRNKYGSFNNLYGSKKSYGIFTDPYVVEEILTWKPEFLLNRRLQNYFYIKKFPKLAKIPAQDYKVPILYRDNSSDYKRVLAVATFIMRGTGLRYASWACKKRYKKYSLKILLKKNQLFNSIFDAKKIVALDKRDMRMYENLVKIKQILDLIKTKDCKNFLNTKIKKIILNL